MVDIGKNIKEIRKRKGLKQKQLAKMIGKCNFTVSRIETGTGNTRWGTIEKISEVLDVSLVELLLGFEIPYDMELFLRRLHKRNLPMKNINRLVNYL